MGAQKIDEDALLVLLTRHAVGYAPEADRVTQSLRVFFLMRCEMRHKQA